MEFELNIKPLDDIIESARNRIGNATKYHTYVTMLNKNMVVHKVYSAEQYIPDFTRTAFSRVRLMSHNLKIETGRWSRIPRELRTCQCDNQRIQTEYHVLVLTQELRIKYNMTNVLSLEQLFDQCSDISDVCKYIYEALKIYNDI